MTWPRLLVQVVLCCVIAGPARGVVAADGTWSNPVPTTFTFTYTGTPGVYSSALPLAVGDAVYSQSTTAGLSNNNAYYVVAASGSNYSLSFAPGGTVANLTTTTGSSNTAVRGVATWGATSATNTQGGASWTAVPSGVDAVATIATNSSPNVIGVQSPVTIGTLIFSATGSDLGLISTNSGTTTAVSALTFATSSGSAAPSINVLNGTRLIRLGFGDATAKNGQLKISGTQGLVLSATTGSIRINTVDWSDFTDGAGGRGTLVIRSNNISTHVRDNLGSGTGALNVVIGDALTPAAGASLSLSNTQNISVNNLDGTALGTVSGSARTLTIGAGGGTNVDFLGAVGSNLSIVKTGSGTQTISGSFAAGTGSVTVSAGQLVLRGTNAFTGSVSVNSGTLAAASIGAAAGSVSSLGTSGTISLGSSATAAVLNWIGSGTETTSKVFAAAGTTGGATITSDAAGQLLSISSDLLVSGSGNKTLTLGGAGNLTFAGVIANGSGASAGSVISLAKTGGGTAMLSGTNTFTGSVSVNGGMLKIGSAEALGATGTTAGTTIASGATLDLNGQTIGESLTLSGTGVSGAGALINSSVSTASVTADIVNPGSFTIGGSGGTALTRVRSTGAVFTMTKTGAGTVTTSGSGHNNLLALALNQGTVVFANTSGYGADRGVTITSGTLRLSGANSNLINDSQSFTMNGGVFDLNGNGEAVASIVGTAGSVRNDAATPATIYVGGGLFGSSSGTFAGVFENGVGVLNLVKEGSGAQTLTGISTYTGATTVSAGTLLVNGTLGNTATTVNAGAVLGGSGGIGGLVSVSGTLSPGNSPGIISLGSLVLTSSATTLIEIDAGTRGVDFDGINILTDSGLTYGGLLSFAFGASSVADNTTFDIFNFTGTPSGSFSSLTSTGYYAGTWTNNNNGTYSLAKDSQTLTFSQSTGAIIVVPEPGALALMGMGLVMTGVMAARRRRLAVSCSRRAPSF